MSNQGRKGALGREAEAGNPAKLLVSCDCCPFIQLTLFNLLCQVPCLPGAHNLAYSSKQLFCSRAPLVTPTSVVFSSGSSISFPSRRRGWFSDAWVLHILASLQPERSPALTGSCPQAHSLINRGDSGLIRGVWAGSSKGRIFHLISSRATSKSSLPLEGPALLLGVTQNPAKTEQRRDGCGCAEHARFAKWMKSWSSPLRSLCLSPFSFSCVCLT